MIKLILEPDGNNPFVVSKVTMEIPDDITLSDQNGDEVCLLREIECFLRAIGYSFKGNLVIDEGEE